MAKAAPSFSAEVKAELAGLIPARECCVRSELVGIHHATHGGVEAGEQPRLRYRLERNDLARKVFQLGRALPGVQAHHAVQRRPHGALFLVDITVPGALLEDLADGQVLVVPEQTCDRKARLRGLFLGSGSVTAPAASHHLEIVLRDEAAAEAVRLLLEALGVEARTTWRSPRHLAYVKDGDRIVRCLSLMGASRAVMEFEKARVVREVAGQVNRRLNFETANLDKTVESARRQMLAISRLEESGRLLSLPAALREMARSRRLHPDLSLGELADRMELGRSAVNHRLRRLVELGEKVV